ncbi:MAG: nucleotidyltransferase domain-containing protein [Candidatus Bathyarchaeota archaeon]|nr:nucleotidyltransferase domain-containing protein [Candidatus Bathyarchaeota archaeon]MDW8040679.1 nucleotidyltransferase domain-containing protein [Nitrososphaerota archaeon]
MNIRRKVSREAATLLYLGAEKEYKQAKLRAAENLGVNVLPTNLEIAMELDKIAEENEGAQRWERLVQMRREALKLMRILEKYGPVLVGSVWRGTIHHKSDIDINVYHNLPEEVLSLLERTGIKILEKGWITMTRNGEWKEAYRILVKLPTNEEAEITVRNPSEKGVRERCEIYGDIISGLSIQDLEKVLSRNPTQRFVPFRKAQLC